MNRVDGRRQDDTGSNDGDAADSEIEITVVSVSCLCLMKETEALESWQQFFSENGLELIPHVPTSMTMAYTLVRREALAFTLAYVANPADAGGLLSTLVPVRSVYFPPLVVMVDRKPTPVERENFRLQGVAHVVESPVSVDDEAAIMGVAASGSWFRGAADRLSVVDVLQMLGADHKSGLVTVSCPHNRELNTFQWNNGSQCGERTICHGWYGRLYLVQGELIHAETPTAVGVAAIAQMIELRSGTIRIHDVFIEPAVRNVNGSIANNILNATLLVDEKKRAQPPEAAKDAANVPPPAASFLLSTARPAPGATRPASAPRAPTPGASPTSPTATSNPATTSTPATGNRPMKTLDPLLGLAPGLQAAAKANNSGNVQEVVGQVDGEGLCAVVVMCTAPLERISGLLAMGNLANWSFVNKKRTLYVITSQDGVVAVTGDVTKNPEPTIKKLQKAVGERR